MNPPSPAGRHNDLSQQVLIPDVPFDAFERVALRKSRPFKDEQVQDLDSMPFGQNLGNEHGAYVVGPSRDENGLHARVPFPAKRSMPLEASPAAGRY